MYVSILKTPANGWTDLPAEAFEYIQKTSHLGIFFDTLDVLGSSQKDSVPSEFINHRSPKTKNHCQKRKPLSPIFVVPLYTQKDTSVSSFDVSLIHWEFIWSEKRPRFCWRSRPRACYSSSVKAAGWERKTIFGIKSVFHSDSVSLTCKCFTVTLWNDKYQRDFLIFHHSRQWQASVLLHISWPVASHGCHACSFTHIVTLNLGPRRGPGRYVLSPTFHFTVTLQFFKYHLHPKETMTHKLQRILSLKKNCMMLLLPPPGVCQSWWEARGDVGALGQNPPGFWICEEAGGGDEWSGWGT